jgi:hypothetical protein
VFTNAQVEKAFKKAARSGSNFSMSASQHRFIAEEILSSRNCNLLVFGGGNDSELWFHCSRGNMVLVEHDENWIPPLPCKIIRPKFKGKVGRWLEKIATPRGIAREWNFVIVDGPQGFSTDCIGRQEPIAWAAKFGKIIFVHDYERPWERKICDHYLGAPKKIIPFKANSNHRVLAVFDSPSSAARPKLS